jgi:RNA polymerase sigma factor (sigma-70 family)
MTEDTGMVELVRRARQGEQPAWNQIVARYSGLIWAITRTYRLTGTQADDVAQTCWLRLVEHLDRIRDPEHVGAWLATTARRESLRVLRAAAREAPPPDDLSTPMPGVEVESPELLAILSDQATRLWQAFKQLPGHCYRLLRALLASPPPSYAEVAAALDMPIGSIGPTRMRCLRLLRQRLEAADSPGRPAESLD